MVTTNRPIIATIPQGGPKTDSRFLPIALSRCIFIRRKVSRPFEGRPGPLEPMLPKTWSCCRRIGQVIVLPRPSGGIWMPSRSQAAVFSPRHEEPDLTWIGDRSIRNRDLTR